MIVIMVYDDDDDDDNNNNKKKNNNNNNNNIPYKLCPTVRLAKRQNNGRFKLGALGTRSRSTSDTRFIVG